MQNTGTLKVTTPTDREIVMTRVFNAPRRLVWEAMTKPELLKQWFYGPPGWSLAVCQVASQVGQEYRYVWRAPDGTEMGMRGVLLQFVPPERAVATEKFDQAWYPGGAVVTTTLVEEGGKTTLTMTVRYDSKETRDSVLKTPMEHGVAMGYDRMAELLASLQAQNPEKGGKK